MTERHMLERMFRPKSIALVGATERSVWSNSAYENLQRFKYQGSLHLVNRNGATVYGSAAFATLRDIKEQIDVALLMVPETAIPDALADLQAVGAAGAVILSSGFAEAGASGKARQQQLTQIARKAGVRLLGPNCLGFVNFVDATPLWTIAARRQPDNAMLAIVSQSGATAGQIAAFAHQQRVGLTYMVSTGNESDIEIGEIIDYLVDEPCTRVIALFVESVRNPQRFAEAARRAQAAGKAIVALKVGNNPTTAKAAQAHTGALVGDNRVFAAVCRQFGVVRVDSLEDLVIASDMIAKVGPLSREGVGLIAMSGGMCEVAADRAASSGVALPSLTAVSESALREVLPSFATANNPLDITGAAVLEPELLSRALQVLRSDAGLGVVACLFDAPIEAEAAPWVGKVIGHIAAGFAGNGARGVLLSHTVAGVSKAGAAIMVEHGVAYSGGGLHHGLKAIGKLLEWSRMCRNARSAAITTIDVVAPRPSLETERGALDFLACRGVDTIPAVLAHSEDEALAAARRFDGPVVLKIASAQIPHKSDVGGVMLDLIGETAISRAYRQILDRVASMRPDAIIDGVIVSPMRHDRVELFVGVMRDPQWGPLIALGLGGVWVEALQDTSLRVLPVAAEDVLEMLDELRGAKLLDGFRGAPPVDRAALARAIVRIGNCALALGPDLLSLEINPLSVSGGTIEALDALVSWNQRTARSEP
ncbi:MAG: acetate--CoA ligase family protein [Steroidobacteraceae bacterium]